MAGADEKQRLGGKSMAERFERLAWDHPTAAGIVAMAVMVAIFGIVGGIERGTIMLPL